MMISSLQHVCSPMAGLATICFIFLLVAMLTAVAQTNRSYNTSNDRNWVLVGGVSSFGANFRIRSGNVDFVLADNEAYDDPLVFEQFSRDENGLPLVHSVTADRLLPQTQYFYATLRPGETRVVRAGRFTTPATEGERFDYEIVLGGCAWTGSEADTFRRMAAHNPLFTLHLGDMHYEDIDDADLNKRLGAIDRVMGSSSQRKLYSKSPIVYVWDDHDYLGNNALSDAGEDGARETAMQSYQLAIPSHKLAIYGEVVPIYHAFTVGAVRFIISDLRSEATAESMFSDQQKAWLQFELVQASRYDFVIWVTSKVWIGEAEDGDDSWLGREKERAELSDYISKTLAGTQNLLAVSSDAHMLGFDDGSNTYYGPDNSTTFFGADNVTTLRSFPILQSGPFDRLGSVKGGPFTEMCTTQSYDRNHQYSTLSFTVNDEGEPCVTATGYDSTDNIAFEKLLCGQIFKEVAPGTGDCSASPANIGTLGLLLPAGLITLIMVAASCCIFEQKLVALGFMSFILFVFSTTIAAGIGIPRAMGVDQWNLFPVAVISLLQMIVVLVYCVIFRRRERAAMVKKRKFDDWMSASRSQASRNSQASSIVSAGGTRTKKPGSVRFKDERPAYERRVEKPAYNYYEDREADDQFVS